MAVKIQVRRGLAAEWTLANPVLVAGEPGFEVDTGKFKIGDGVTAWNSLAYLGGAAWADITGKPSTFPPTIGSSGTTAVAGNDSRLTDARTPTAHTHPLSDVSGHNKAAHDSLGIDAATLDGLDSTAFQTRTEKGQANGYASLGADGKVPSGQLPASGGADPFTAKLRQTADVTNATVTLANLTGLSFAFEANSFYCIEFYLLCTSAAATTGYSFALDVSVAVTNVALTFNHQLANAGTLTGGQSIADATRTGLSSGVPTAGALTPVFGGGLLMSGASAGTAQLQFAPEVAASATCKLGSVMRVMKVT